MSKETLPNRSVHRTVPRISLRARTRCGLFLCAVLLPLWPSTAGIGQVNGQASDPYPGPIRPKLGPEPLGSEPISPHNPFKLEHMREEERHKRLLADTARLVELTNELKTEVDKAAKDELSLDVVRKAAEIEKLARDVKERMRS